MLDVVVMVTVLPLEDTALHQVDMVPTVGHNMQVVSVVMDLVETSTSMVEVETDMDHGEDMVTTTVGYHIWVDHNHLVTTKRTMLTDTNLMQRGVQVEMDLCLVTEVPEVERV